MTPEPERCPWDFVLAGHYTGNRSLKVTADTYTHVLMVERELDYAAVLAS